MTNRIWKLLGFLLIACLLLSGVSALAEPGTLKVTLGTDDVFKFNNGVTFELYKVGVPNGTTDSAWAPNKDGGFGSVVALEEAAKGQNNEWSSDQITAIIGQVEAVLEGKSSVSAVTNASGEATYTGLQPGIYYIKKRDESYPKRLTVNPFLIAVPALNTADPYNVAFNLMNSEAKVKYEYEPPELIEFPVTKVWRDDDDFDGIRPSTIEVKLQRDYKAEGQADKEFNDAQKNVELTAENEWKYIWTTKTDNLKPGSFTKIALPATDEDDNPYIYSAIEMSREYNYDDPIYEKYGRIITNPHTPDYGCLELTKAVTIGGQPTTTNLVDGEYSFTITGPVELEEIRRNAANYYDGDNKDDAKSKFTITITGGQSNTWKKEKLMPGTYVVKEVGTLPNNVVSSIGSEGVEVKVTAGSTSEKPVQLTITNNLNAGSLTITKAVTLNGSKTDDVRLNGTYKFTVVGPDNYTKTVEIKVEKGKSTPVTLTDLVPGGYTVTEDPEGLPAGVTIASGSGETYVVNAGADTTATITNDLGIGSIKITKHVTVNGKSTKETKADGTYTFTVKGPSYPKGHTVTIKITKGAANSVQLDDLLAGAYTVTEETSKLPSKMTLSSTNDLRLNVTGGTVTDASFTNDLGTPTPTPGNHVVVNPTPTPIPNTSINGQKVWNDEKNVHNTRPETITVQLLRDGVVIRETNVTGNSTDERWTYSFTGLPRMNAQGKDYEYTVREQPVTGYTTRIDGLTIFNDLIPQTPKEYTNFNGQKIWDDNDNADGARPNYIIVRLMRDGEEVDRRTVTGANSWQYTFQNMPLDDGYGHTYEYTIREDAVEGYVARIKDFDITNSRLPEVVNPLPDGLDNMVELYDYETPTWGRPLKTGDELPLYPIIFGGIGLTALVALVVLIVIGKKRENHAA